MNDQSNEGKTRKNVGRNEKSRNEEAKANLSNEIAENEKRVKRKFFRSFFLLLLPLAK